MRPWLAQARSSSRIQRMPSGSRPLAGSSRISTCGSPSIAAAMPSRWLHAQRVALELALGGRGQADQLEHLVGPLARDSRPAAQTTRRWLRPVRPLCALDASSTAPTVPSGSGRSA